MSEEIFSYEPKYDYTEELAAEEIIKAAGGSFEVPEKYDDPILIVLPNNASEEVKQAAELLCLKQDCTIKNQVIP